MDCKEIKNEGLSRTFAVNVPVTELLKKLDRRIEEIRPQMRLKGFRPGKVPASHVKKMYGKSIMGELLEGVIGEANQKALDDANIRPASQPDVHLESDIEAVMEGRADLDYHFHVEAMPDFEPAPVADIEIERPVAEADEATVTESLARIAEQNQQYEARAKTAKAKDGDAVVIDFVGRIDGEAFEGGSAEETTLVLGSGRFIPGFEEQLVGVKTGEEKDVTVTFPETYPAENLAGKEAVFAVTVREVRAPKTPEIDDEFAKGLGFESVDQLRDLVKQQVQGEHDRASRQKAKRALLDALDEKHDFDLPPRMVDAEFSQIWQQVQAEKEKGNLTEAEAAKSDEELEAEYRRIAARRVRLGLVLAEIGRQANVQITDEEVNRALIAEARNFPGQERQVIEYFRKNPGALAQLRAPIYEDKVVDLLLGQVKVTDKTVDRETLLADDEEPTYA